MRIDIVFFCSLVYFSYIASGKTNSGSSEYFSAQSSLNSDGSTPSARHQSPPLSPEASETSGSSANNHNSPVHHPLQFVNQSGSSSSSFSDHHLHHSPPPPVSPPPLPPLTPFAPSSGSSYDSHKSDSLSEIAKTESESYNEKGRKRAPGSLLFHETGRMFWKEKGKIHKRLYQVIKRTPERRFAQLQKEAEKISLNNSNKHKEWYRKINSNKLKSGRKLNGEHATIDDLPLIPETKREIANLLSDRMIKFHKKKGENYLIPYKISNNIIPNLTRKRRPGELNDYRNMNLSSPSASITTASSQSITPKKSTKKEESSNFMATSKPSNRRAGKRPRSPSPSSSSSSSSSSSTSSSQKSPPRYIRRRRH